MEEPHLTDATGGGRQRLLYEPARMLRNFGVAVLGEGISKGAAFAALIVVARTLSRSEFGRFSFVVALVSIAVLFADVGLQVATTRSIAADPARAPRYVTAALVVGGGFAILAYALVGGAGALGLLPHDVAAAVAIYGVVLLLAVPINAYWSLLRGRERQDLVYLTYALSSVALLVAVVVANRTGLGIEGTLLLYVCSYVLRLVLTLVVVERKVEHVRLRFDRATAGSILFAAQAAAVAYVFQEVYSHVDVVLLGFLVGAADVGAYAAAYRLVDAVTFLTAGALTAAAFPVFSRLAAQAPKLVAPLYDRVVRLLMSGLVVASLLLLGLSSQLVHAVYGFGGKTGHLLALLAPSTLLIPLNFTTTYLALATGRTGAAIVSTGLAALVNVAANLVAVPIWGVEAAPLATLLAEVTMVSAFQLALRRTGFESEAPASALRTGLILLVPAALALTLPHATAIALAGAVAAPVLLWLAGVLRLDDVAALRRAGLRLAAR